MSEGIFQVREHVCDGSHIREYAGCTSDSQEQVLQLHIRQYVPLDLPDPPPPDAVTIISSTSLGFAKECYEPLWDELYQSCKERGISIRGVWAVDPANLGKSSAINEHKLSTLDSHSWTDHARDLFLLVNHFRGMMPRPLVGIGHSMGANIITNLAYMHPRLFSTLILLDPSIDPELPKIGRKNEILIPARTNLSKPDTWPNREEAAKAYMPLMKTWDPRCAQLMIKHGFRETPTALYPNSSGSSDSSSVTLMAPKNHELMNMLRYNSTVIQEDGSAKIDRATHADIHPSMYSMPLYRSEALAAWQSLPQLRPSTLFMLGERTILHLDKILQGAAVCGTGVGGSGGIPEGKVATITIPKAGHFFPLELVKDTADRCSQWLDTALQSFREEQKAWETKQRSMTPRDHLLLPETWVNILKPSGPGKVETSKL